MIVWTRNTDINRIIRIRIDGDSNRIDGAIGNSRMIGAICETETTCSRTIALANHVSLFTLQIYLFAETHILIGSKDLGTSYRGRIGVVVFTVDDIHIQFLCFTRHGIKIETAGMGLSITLCSDI